MSTDEIQRVYVTERREVLRAFFKDRPLLPAAPITADNPLCQDFVRDFTAQNEAVELIAPIVVAHDYADPELVAHLFDRCPDLELRSYKIGKSGPAVGPRNFLLYRADIDNDASNGEELSLLEEVMSKRQPVYGAEIVASSTFRLVDLEHCTTRGFVGIGALRRYPVDFDVSGEDPQTALYGVFRYQGSTYLYSVIDSDPKAPPLELTAFDPSGFGSFNRLCKYINGRLKN